MIFRNKNFVVEKTCSKDQDCPKNHHCKCPGTRRLAGKFDKKQFNAVGCAGGGICTLKCKYKKLLKYIIRQFKKRLDFKE